MFPVIRASSFARYIWLMLAIYMALAVAFVIYVNAEKQIDRANILRLQSYLLAHELRQSSDELTRMARTYAATGNPIYKKYYNEILSVRNGWQPRAERHTNSYWDLVLHDDERPHPRGQQIALLDMMRQVGFTQQEFAKLAQAKANSDALTRTELTSMQMIDNDKQHAQSVHNEAMKLLQSEQYYQAKAAIVLPIQQFEKMMVERTTASVEKAESTATTLRWIFIFFGLILLYVLWRAYRALYCMLGSSVDRLYKHISDMGNGNFTSPIIIAPGMENSVLGWLAVTQNKLNKLNNERNAAEEKILRLTQLYAALSQCNQVILRCTSDAELFPQICRVAVQFAGIKMAWIGRLDYKAHQVIPVTSYGEGIEYLDNIHISLLEDNTYGHGPISTTVRTDQPYWCQDFQHDPITSPWHERAAFFGFGAAVALPLHQDNQIIGVLTLYTEATYAFDEATQNLLTEMVLDIDYALDGFAREAEQQHAQQMETERIFMLEHITSDKSLTTILEEIVLRLESINPGSLCSILLLTEDKKHLKLGAAPSLPGFFNAAIARELIGAGFGSCGNAAYTGQRTIVEDITLHPYWEAYRPIAEKAGLRSCWSEPIYSNDNTILGTFAIYHRMPALPTNNDIQLIEMATHFIAIAIERKQSEAHIHQLVHYDPLTHLPNRVLLDERARQAISMAQRSGTPLAVMFFDLDHFKNINDNLGHRVGDELLVTLSDRLQSILREEDTVSRLGGDEFIFVLPNTNVDDVSHVAEKLLNVVAQPYYLGNHELTITSSIGIAMYPEDGEDFDTLIKAADVAMYRAKQAGRNGHCYFTHEMQTRSARNLMLENALRRALERNQIDIYYQPQIAMRDGRIIGVEALVRWHHPELGMIAPSEFIPIAENSGQIYQIGEWVLRSATRQLKAWMDAGMAPMTLAVNLSAVQFRHMRLPELITTILEESQLAPQYLELELTEGVAMDDPLAAIAVMDNLHNRGIRMSIDDFGTGYSSLNYLKKFKIYKLKIDQSFVHDISTDPEDRAIVAAIISMAQSLGFQTIAEGVETASQLAFLQAQGCDEVQGYYYSAALPAGHIQEFVRNWVPVALSINKPA